MPDSLLNLLQSYPFSGTVCTVMVQCFSFLPPPAHTSFRSHLKLNSSVPHTILYISLFFPVIWQVLLSRRLAPSAARVRVSLYSRVSDVIMRIVVVHIEYIHVFVSWSSHDTVLVLRSNPLRPPFRSTIKLTPPYSSYFTCHVCS